MAMLNVRVLRKKQEAVDIVSFELAHADGAPLPPFSAGSHVDVHVPGGLIRQYSLCNDATERHRYRIAVLRDPKTRGGSAGMHDMVQEGDLITISEPHNHFPLLHAPRTILLAGGIGITPLLCMAQRLSAIGADFALHYCTRSPDRTAFRDELKDAPFAANVVLHHDDGDAAQKLQLAQAIGNPEDGSSLYVCGPPGFIDFVVAGAAAAGFSHEHVHREYFGAAPQDTTGDREFDVKIASTGRVIKIAADQTVVHALSDAGIEISTSCEQGVCGTCITRVLQGECDHRDLFFTEDEKSRMDQFTPCCSRAKGPLLVLDL